VQVRGGTRERKARANVKLTHDTRGGGHKASNPTGVHPSARGAEGGWQAPRGGPKEGCKVVLSSSSGFKSHLAEFEFK